MRNKIEIKGFPVYQNGQDFIIGTAKISDLLQYTMFTERLVVGFDEKERPIYSETIQRRVENTRANQIADFLINDETVEQIKDTFPYQYEKIKELLASDILKKKTDDEDSMYDDNGNLASNTTKSSRSQKVEIKKVAIPETEKTPEWIKPFINFTDIISANISSFPCEALGISVNKAHVNYTNIVKF